MSSQQEDVTSQDFSEASFTKASLTRLEFYLFLAALVIFITIWWGAIYANDRDDTKALQIQVTGLEQVSGDTTRAVQNINNTTTDNVVALDALSTAVHAMTSETTEVNRVVQTAPQIDNLLTTQSTRWPFDVDSVKMQTIHMQGYVPKDTKSVQMKGDGSLQLVDKDDETNVIAVTDVKHYEVSLELLLRQISSDVANQVYDSETVSLPKLYAHRIQNALCEGQENPIFSFQWTMSPVARAEDLQWSCLSLNPQESVILMKHHDGSVDTVTLLDMGILDQFNQDANSQTGCQIRVVGLEAHGAEGLVVNLNVEHAEWRKQVTRSVPSF
jgi:hypothetical protein